MNHRSHDIELRRLLDQTSWAARLARTLVGSEEAEDLLQEVWVQTLEHPPATAVESPRAWLGTILRRGATRKRRAAGRRTDRERRAARDEALPSTHVLRGREEDRRVLVEAVLDLPKAMREPLPVRQWVLSFPWRVRYLLAINPRLCRAVRKVFLRAVLGFYSGKAKEEGVEGGRTGAVNQVQRFGKRRTDCG